MDDDDFTLPGGFRHALVPAPGGGRESVWARISAAGQPCPVPGGCAGIATATVWHCRVPGADDVVEERVCCDRCGFASSMIVTDTGCAAPVDGPWASS